MTQTLHQPIALLGGTFDPIHNGHIQLAEQLIQTFKIQFVSFVPCYQPVHRDTPKASPEDRLLMLKTALKNRTWFMVEDYEMQQKRPVYMIETLRFLKEHHPHTPLCLTMGMDAFAALSSWHEWESLLTYAHIIVATRPYAKVTLSKAMEDFLNQHLTTDSNVLHNTPNGAIMRFEFANKLSATEIRERIQTNQSIAQCVPEAVQHYIKKHNIYHDTTTS